MSAQEDAGKGKRLLDNPRAFNGAGGKTVDPATLNAIPIGLFAPMEPGNPAAEDLYKGVTLALEQANRGGGYKGVKFRLVRRWAKDPWAAGSREVVRLRYQDLVWGIIGFREGASHIAQQIAAKAYVPVLAPVSSALSMTHTGVPWIFRLPPDDGTQARLLVQEGILKKGFKSVGIICGTGHDDRSAALEIEKELIRGKKPPLFFFKVTPGSIDMRELAHRVKRFRPRALILCATPSFIARLLTDLPSDGVRCPVFLPWIPGMDMGKMQGIYKGALHMLAPFQAPDQGKSGGNYRQFRRDFEKRFGAVPSYSAAYGYDAARMIVLAIRAKGLNRAEIRLGLEELGNTGNKNSKYKYNGICGPVKWDNGGGNDGRPVLKEY